MKKPSIAVLVLALVVSGMSFASAGIASAAGATQMDAGGYTSCAVVGGGVKCWGDGDTGSLGNGISADSNIPVSVVGISNAVQVSVSESPCALLKNGTVKCWGPNGEGELGNPAAGTGLNSPVQVTGIDDAVQVSTGYLGACALLDSGRVKCWGDNTYGQLGDGTGLNDDSDIPVSVVGIKSAVQISAGDEYSVCALLASGRVKCWGYNNHGQLGDDTTDDSDRPVTVKNLPKAAQVTTGYYWACAITRSEKAKCWGDNISGQIGDGTSDERHTAVGVKNLRKVVDLSAEDSTTCAVVHSGKVKCWGYSSNGEFGNGTTDPSPLPTAMHGISDAESISGGWDHTCLLRRPSGKVQCTGDNGSGQLGDGSFDPSLDLVNVLL